MPSSAPFGGGGGTSCDGGSGSSSTALASNLFGQAAHAFGSFDGFDGFGGAPAPPPGYFGAAPPLGILAPQPAPAANSTRDFRPPTRLEILVPQHPLLATGTPVPAGGLFGAAQQPAPVTSFSAPAAPFGSTPTATTTGGGMGNYAPIPRWDKETASVISLQCISAMLQFE